MAPEGAVESLPMFGPEMETWPLSKLASQLGLSSDSCPELKTRSASKSAPTWKEELAKQTARRGRGHSLFLSFQP